MYNFLLPKEEKDLENKKNSNKKDDDHMKQKSMLASSRWSHLPLDLLGTIADRLYYGDEVRFRAVCKNWHWQATHHKTTLVKSLPWIVKLIRPSIHRFEFQLYEPLTNFKPTAFHKIDFSQFLSTHLLKHIKITCKHGWLLFDIPRNDWCSTTFVFFSLLSKKVVTPPRLGHNRSPHSFYITAFSPEPSSQDFVFIVLKPRGEQKHLISTFSRRENRWTSTMFVGVPFLCYGCIVVFIRGIFYFVNGYGHVASYNIAAGVWKQETVSINHSIITRIKVRYEVRYAFELNGQLMVVCLRSYGDSFPFCVRRFDWSKKVWVPVSSLGERAICVGFNSFSVIAVKENATNCGVLPNTINVLVDPGCNVYRVENGGSIEWINSLVLAHRNIARELSVDKELNFWVEPPDYFVNRKQRGTEMEIVGNEEVNVASTSKRGPVELLTINKKSTRDQTVEDDEVEEYMKDLHQLKRSRGDPADPAAVKLCAIGYRGKHSRKK